MSATTGHDDARRARQKRALEKLRDKGLAKAPRVLPAQRGVVAPLSRSKTPERATTPKQPPKPLEPLTGLQPDPRVTELVETFEIPVPGEDWQAARISANDRFHRQEVAKRSKRWRATAAEVASTWSAEALPWSRVVVWYRFPTNARREVANLQPTTKAIVDGLVDAGVMVDDRDEFSGGQDNRRIWPNGPHRVVVQVWAVSEQAAA